jgi:hypothetical protein
VCVYLTGAKWVTDKMGNFDDPIHSSTSIAVNVIKSAQGGQYQMKVGVHQMEAGVHQMEAGVHQMEAHLGQTGQLLGLGE